MDIKDTIEKTGEKLAELVISSVAQEENIVIGEKVVFPDMPEACLAASREAQVLLKNDGTLPLAKDCRVALFGRCQVNYFYVGYGSGGDVKAPYYTDIVESLEADGVTVDKKLYSVYKSWCDENIIDHGVWGHWPMCYPEMPLDEPLVREASESNDVAVVIIGRAAGEDRENILEKGSYYLTDEERNMLNLVTESFEKTVVVMDCGNIVDMAWTEEYGDKLSAIIYAWQCGMESCSALADVLTGKFNPCGKLVDTIARNYEDYPSAAHFGDKKFNEYTEDIFVGYRYYESFGNDAVLYPFGFGLSYTDFEMKADGVKAVDGGYEVNVAVKNTGSVAGKEIVQLYLSKPQAELSNPAVTLVAFAKTSLLQPDESERLTLFVSEYDMCSFDDTGATGYKNAYVLQGGEYGFLIGNRCDMLEKIHTVSLEKRLYQQLSEVCSVQLPFDRIVAREVDGQLLPIKVEVKPGEVDLKERILENLPEEIGYKGDQGIRFSDVKSGRNTLDEFISQLENRELEALTRGEGAMDSSLGVPGNAGAFCGVIPSLRDKGVPPIITTDGPAGIRIKKYTSLLPCGTALACTWNTLLVESLADVMGREMKHHETDVILAPGMNIHRNVLCGRNFEYFSEDPVVSGKMAAAFVKGIQSNGVSACPKHFACNNQEFNRVRNDSRISQRALREVYLRCFEICIRDAKPMNIMTSYNKINGVWSHYNYDLVTTVLRGEWNYGGSVMTDWWMRKSKSPEFPDIHDNAYRVRAQVDVYMPGDHNHFAKKYKSDNTLLRNIDTEKGITRAEIERTAKSVLNVALWLDK